MPTAFPAALDAFPVADPNAPGANPVPAKRLTDLGDAIEAVEARVGIKASISALTSWASITDYGATGGADDTAAIRAAVAAVAGTGGHVHVPAGTFITQPLTIPPGVVIEGVTGQGYVNASTAVANAATQSRLKLKAGSTGALISPDDTGAQLATHVRLADLALDCNAIAQAAIDIPDEETSISRFWRMERLYITNIGNHIAMYVGNLNTACILRDSILFNGTSGTRAGGDGLHWYGQDGILDNTWIGYFGANGLTVLGGASDTYLAMRGGGIFTCTAGVVVGGSGAVFEGVSFDHNYNDGAYVAYPCSFIGCWFHTNSRQTANTWANVHVQGSPAVNLYACRATPHGGEVAFDPAYHLYSSAAGAGVNDQGTTVASTVSWGTSYKNW